MNFCEVIISKNESTGYLEKDDLNLNFKVKDFDSERIASLKLFKAQTKLNKKEIHEGLLWQFNGLGEFFIKDGSILGKSNFIVIAIWPVKSNMSNKFYEISVSNAKKSVLNEKGCTSFGVFRSINNNNIFCLIEVFNSNHAFDEHLKTEHFSDFIEFARPIYLGDTKQTIKGTTL